MLHADPISKRRSRWKRLLLWAALSVLTLVIALVIVADVFEEDITRRLLNTLKTHLRAELTVHRAYLSLLRAFPEAAVGLEDVRLKDRSGRPLLEVREMSFRFKWWRLFEQRVEVNRVIIRDGRIAVRIDKSGRANYEVWEERPKTVASDENLQISLENARLQNLYVSYENNATRQALNVRLKNAEVGGDFSAQRLSLSSQADMEVVRLQVNESRCLIGQPLRYRALLAVDLSKGLYDFQQVELSVAGNTFDISGFISHKGAFSDVNLTMTGREGDVSLITALLPEPYSRYFDDFHSRGTYSFSASVRGRLSRTEVPSVKVQAALRNGTIASEKLQGPLRNVHFRAVLNATASGKSSFEIADFIADFDDQTLTFHLSIADLEDPIIDFHLQGALPLRVAYGLFNTPSVQGGDGVVRISNLSIRGRYADMLNTRTIARIQAQAEVQMEKASVTFRGTPVQVSNGRVTLDGNRLQADSLQMVVGQSTLQLHGYAHNVLPVLFADSLHADEAQLLFSGRLSGPSLDMGQLFDLFSVPEEEVTSADSTALDSLRQLANQRRQRLLERLRGAFEVRMDTFYFRKIMGQALNGQLAFDNGRLYFQSEVQGMKGSAAVSGIAHFAPQPSLKMRAHLRNIDVQTLMEQCNNFEQDIVTAENLRGNLSGKVVVYACWDTSNRFLSDQLRALADIRIVHGELVGLKMLEDFSTFIHIEDLRQVRFAELQNYLEVNRRTLYLPLMFIQSNAANLTLSGTHTFDNFIDYRMKVNVGQLLLQRIKRHDPDLEPLPAREGWFNVFYTIRGHVDKYEMKRGKKEVVREFERSEGFKMSIAQRIEDEFRGIDGRPLPGTGEQITSDKARPGAVPSH